ncbi:MAG: diadenylate cyclase CdaA [Bacillota bacterium]|jgi:diadenylate cyclase|nr:diadenylate cyclase CdaA [Thermoanaerobacteraceae bacterium]
MKIMPFLELSPRLILDFVDVVLVGIVAYAVWRLIRGTRAVQLLKGLLVLAVLTVVAYKLQLHLLKWTLEKVWTMAFVAVPIIFQPEIRRVLEKLGQGAPFLRVVSADTRRRLVQEVAAAAAGLSRTRTGALIAFERRTGLREYMEIGVMLDALVSRELLLSIFEPHTALHDGAVLIAGDRIVAAACFLPLAAQHTVPPDLGARHRAAVGLSEQTDALVVVVSEETGRISLAENGRLTRLPDASELEVVLKRHLFPEGLGKLRFGRNHRNKPFETGL